MIEETAIVIKRDGEHAWVQAERQSSCGQCSAQKGCGTTVMSQWFGARLKTVRALNPIHAEIGDRVVVGLKEDALVKSALIIYLLPLFTIAILVLFGYGLYQYMGWAITDLAIAAFAGIGLITGWWLIKRFVRGKSTDYNYQPVILRHWVGNTRSPIPITISREF